MLMGRKGWLSQLKKREFILPSSFCSIWVPKRLDEPHHTEVGGRAGMVVVADLLTQPTDSNANYF